MPIKTDDFTAHQEANGKIYIILPSGKRENIPHGVPFCSKSLKTYAAASNLLESAGA